MKKLLRNYYIIYLWFRDSIILNSNKKAMTKKIRDDNKFKITKIESKAIFKIHEFCFV